MTNKVLSKTCKMTTNVTGGVAKSPTLGGGLSKPVHQEMRTWEGGGFLSSAQYKA